jgi:hypothetical protein
LTIIPALAKISSAGRRIHGVGQADRRARVFLHHDLVAAQGEFLHAGRGQADTRFLVFDLFRYAY